ncbi:hypothetical protein [Kineosporia babensis]|uniref:Uncharacterized protein n=1 Tax=Kineosporia babensis TaxID=499548 RepID=A0A9X1SSX5_9ACTN|nr:hypothetical protein [Kineosporia babensis]MCD5310060.1 hypothetical protein [Kineosporia babensis]
MSDSHTNPSGLPAAGPRIGTETAPNPAEELSVAHDAAPAESDDEGGSGQSEEKTAAPETAGHNGAEAPADAKATDGPSRPENPKADAETGEPEGSTAPEPDKPGKDVGGSDRSADAEPASGEAPKGASPEDGTQAGPAPTTARRTMGGTAAGAVHRQAAAALERKPAEPASPDAEEAPGRAATEPKPSGTASDSAPLEAERNDQLAIAKRKPWSANRPDTAPIARPEPAATNVSQADPRPPSASASHATEAPPADQDVPEKPVFASRRERKLYETGAISLPGVTTEDTVADQPGGPQTSPISAPETAPTGINPQPERKQPGRLIQKLSVGAAALIALAGVVVLVVGGLKATVWAPSDVVVGKLGANSQKFLTTEVGALEMAGPRLQIQVQGAGSDPVFIGIGRASDVDAYLGEAASDRIVGLDRDQENRLITETAGSDTAEVLDPAGADVWKVSVLGQGSAELTWPEPAEGQWRMVIATDGTGPAPQDVTLTWSGQEPVNRAPVWIAVGAVLLGAGLIGLFLLRARNRRPS